MSLRIGHTELKISWLTFPFAAAALFVGQGEALALAFPSVTVHELAHAVCARALGMDVQSIEITPFGGVARVAALAGMPSREAAVALAGPAASLLVAMGAVFVHRFMPYAEDLLRSIIAMNLSLCALNLLPAFPLDGGRVLRASLTPALGLERATLVAGRAGMLIGLAVLVLGIAAAVGGVINATLLLSGVCMVFLARAESRLPAGRAVLEMSRRAAELERRGELRVRRVAVQCGATADALARRVLPGEFLVYEVLDEKMRLIGSVPESRVFEAVMDGRGATAVGKLV